MSGQDVDVAGLHKLTTWAHARLKCPGDSECRRSHASQLGSAESAGLIVAVLSRLQTAERELAEAREEIDALNAGYITAVRGRDEARSIGLTMTDQDVLRSWMQAARTAERERDDAREALAASKRRVGELEAALKVVQWPTLHDDQGGDTEQCHIVGCWAYPHDAESCIVGDAVARAGDGGAS